RDDARRYENRPRGRARTSQAAGLRRAPCRGRRTPMLLALAAIIAIAWLLGFTVFHVASGAIHILIIIAVIVAIVHFVQGRRAPL
ncbi:MAG TPA: lmo0937 family membrane protein, partial [Kofleriaceae bacterium]|nr:lmo0937 family membrane protein [Kofleriaceae bacterium]